MFYIYTHLYSPDWINLLTLDGKHFNYQHCRNKQPLGSGYATICVVCSMIRGSVPQHPQHGTWACSKTHCMSAGESCPQNWAVSNRVMESVVLILVGSWTAHHGALIRTYTLLLCSFSTRPCGWPWPGHVQHG